MPIHTLSMGAIEHLTKSMQDGFERTVELRQHARGRWIEYLREALLNDFEGNFKAATAGTSTAVVFPKNLLEPTLVFGVHQFFKVEGLDRLDARISFIWREADYSVVTVERAADLPAVRYDIDRFLSQRLEVQVLHHLAGALHHMHAKLLPAPPEK